MCTTFAAKRGGGGWKIPNQQPETLFLGKKKYRNAQKELQRTELELERRMNRKAEKMKNVGRKGEEKREREGDENREQHQV